MNLRKLPPSMLLALGLACGAEDDETGPCLEPPTTNNDTSGSASATSTSSATNVSTSSTSEISTSACLDVGTCLDGTTGPCLSTSPCLEPPWETTGTGSGSGTDTGTGSGTDTGTGTGTGSSTGMMLEEPPSRASAVQRVLERGSLPADVAARLRGTLPPDQGEGRDQNP